ncbi:MAG: CHAT domain-containing protein, partial [Candidatus Bipolaricaulia bacterium]
ESDGKLHTYEVFGLPLQADLVVMSACETFLLHFKEMEEQVRAVRGTSEEEPVELSPELLEALTAGDEIVGLTRAFISAGTPSVMSTLWEVVSRPTRDLMVAFYGFLGSGLDLAEALRQAQLVLLKDEGGSYQHPLYWAAFVPYGDWGGDTSTEPPDTGKLDYELYRALEQWTQREHLPGETPPMVSVLVVLADSVTQDDIETLEALSEDLEVEGAFGRLVQVALPLPLVEAVESLPRVRSVSLPPEAHSNQFDEGGT